MSDQTNRMGFLSFLGGKTPEDRACEQLRREIEEAEAEGRRTGTISAEEHRSRMDRFFAEFRAEVAAGHLKP